MLFQTLCSVFLLCASAVPVAAATIANDSISTQWVEIVEESQDFFAPLGIVVRYGANEKYAVKKVFSAGIVNCNNATFGDPAPFVKKSCYIDKPSTEVKPIISPVKIADEHASFRSVSGSTMRYGAGQSWKTRVVGSSGVCDNNFFGGDPAPFIFKACYADDVDKGYLKPLALLFDARETVIVDVTAKDAELYSSVPFGRSPANGFYYLNNTYGKSYYLNGTDYQTTFKSTKEHFPNNSLIEWSWPDAGTGQYFAFAYPEIIYGGTPYGNPYKTIGFSSRQVKSISKFTAKYDVALSGNLNSYNLLMDVYLTAKSDSQDGSHIAEVSFFPHLLDPNNLTGIVSLKSVGLVSVSKSGLQILIRPVTTAGKPRDVNAATVDWKEIFNHLIKLGWLTGDEFLRSAEFGPEIQAPNHYNTRPAKGSMKINQLVYDWE
jgi:hypothetical protein